MDWFLLLKDIFRIVPEKSWSRKLKLFKYPGTNRSMEGTLKSQEEQRDGRELQGMVNNKEDGNGMNEVKGVCGLPRQYNCVSLPLPSATWNISPELHLSLKLWCRFHRPTETPLPVRLFSSTERQMEAVFWVEVFPRSFKQLFKHLVH